MEYPVVGVSWFEAVAFCRWLREVTDDETVVLPTEQQWQRAAQGDDERIYPWGNDWD
jgi:formylglycine-generating enzyme required for sulfatase activity